MLCNNETEIWRSEVFNISPETLRTLLHKKWFNHQYCINSSKYSLKCAKIMALYFVIVWPLMRECILLLITSFRVEAVDNISGLWKIQRYVDGKILSQNVYIKIRYTDFNSTWIYLLIHVFCVRQKGVSISMF